MINLFLEALIKYLLGLLTVSTLLFIPAGTIKFIYAQIFICLLFIPMFIVGMILFFKDPDLLRKRLDSKEKETTQKYVILFSAIMFILGFISAGLNYRYGLSSFPKIVPIISSILFIVFYVLYAEVLRENKNLSRTVKAEKKQKLVTTGLYGIIRHPQYSITIFLFLLIPFILNSPLSLIIFLVYPIIIIVRINNEEKVLENNIKDYTKYKEKVKYKLFPFIY